MIDKLLAHFRLHISLNSEEEKIVTASFRSRKYRKHQYILQEGEVSRLENFVVSGATRTYEIDEKGQEHILQFGTEGWWVGDMYSFLSDRPSDKNIDCFEDTLVMQITRPELEELYVKVPKLERYFRILVQNAYVASMNRISSSLSKPALERYREFVQHYPDLEQRIPNHQIASFLGITPQSLSRLRSNSRTNSASSKRSKE